MRVRGNHFSEKRGYTLVEVLMVSMLLAFFLVGFYEGSQRMAVATLVQQDRAEALLMGRKLGEQWKNGVDISGVSTGFFLNGVGYNVAQATSAYSATGSSLTQLALTIGWSEPDPNGTGSNPSPRAQHIKDVYLKY